MTTEQKIETLTWFNQINKLKSILNDLNANALIPSDNVSEFGTTTPITAVPASFADVAAVRTYLVAAIPIIETRLDNIETKINLLLTALVEAGQMEE